MAFAFDELRIREILGGDGVGKGVDGVEEEG